MTETRKKSLDTNSNSYIIIYSAVMVVIVAFLLAFIFQALKPMQDANVALDIRNRFLPLSTFAILIMWQPQPAIRKWW